MTGKQVVGPGSDTPPPVQGVYVNASGTIYYKITVTPVQYSFNDLDNQISLASGKPSKKSRYTAWNKLTITDGGDIYDLEQSANIN